jgi:hypothetical protein
MNFLQAGEKQYPIAIDFFVLKNVTKKFGLKLSEIQSVIDDFEKLECLVFESLKRGAIRSSTVFDLKESDVTDLLSNKNVLGDFILIFNESIIDTFSPSKKN